ncbi:MAG: hypothetical protein OXT74_07635 [Candidatus Poribacteria bacterium]|nr:hypothetical protein [Candidatus Poribacteria bacterium]
MKKDWKFTVPAVMVFCVLLIGVVALYSTSTPPELKTVYAMPERSSLDNPPALNTGGIPPQILMAANETVEPKGSVVATTTPVVAANETVSGVQTPDACCEDETALLVELSAEDSDQNLSSDEQEKRRQHKERYLKWRKDFSNWVEKQNAYSDALVAQSSDLESRLFSLLSFASPAEREEARENLEREYPSANVDEFFTKIPTQPPVSKTPEEVIAEIEDSTPTGALNKVKEVLDSEWDRLIKEGQELGYFR